MIQPDTWKAIDDYSSKAWSVLGPLVGVLIGAWLTRRGDFKNWERENRKEECRELIIAITHAATLAINVGSGTSGDEAYNAYLETVKTIHDRIFIAADIEKAEILDIWAYAVSDFGSKKIDAAAFSDRVEQIRKSIVGLVVRT
jgi:hypothetical protein